MAQKTIVHFTDDLDGSEATQSVEFGYQGKAYKLDLSDQNASELEEALAPYIAAAQKAAGASGTGVVGASERRRPSSAPAATTTRRKSVLGRSRTTWRCQRGDAFRRGFCSSSRRAIG